MTYLTKTKHLLHDLKVVGCRIDEIHCMYWRAENYEEN